MSKPNLEKRKKHPERKEWVKVGMSTCGIAAGAEEVFDFLSQEFKKRKISIEVLRCGCSGKCYAEPLVEVKVDRLPAITYGCVDKNIAVEIVEKHIINKKLIDGHIYGAKEC